MASVKRQLSARVNGGVAEVYLRLSLTMNIKQRVRSGIYIRPQRFKDGTIVYPRGNPKENAELHEINSRLQELEGLLIEHCLRVGAEAVTREQLAEVVDRFHHPERHEQVEAVQPFFGTWERFVQARDITSERREGYYSLMRTLHRYECWRRETRQPDFTLTIDGLTADDVMDFEGFYRNEWRYYDKYPQMYLDYPAVMRLHHKTARPQRRGDNKVVGTIKMIRAFYNWCYAHELTANRPFDKYEGRRPERYGTPWYLTLEEVEQLAEADFSASPALAVQRDIFVFQCQIGCRVSDLVSLQKSNVVGDMVEFVPKKTARERSDVLRVPLNERARMIIARYAKGEDARLLPFISSQRYNNAIKEACRLAGINRVVTVINPSTGQDERRHIYEVASSHLARRTFIGNLYKRVKDPNLVGSLSGHKEGSKAFARYRSIDDDMKRELVRLME